MLTIPGWKFHGFSNSSAEEEKKCIPGYNNIEIALNQKRFVIFLPDLHQTHWDVTCLRGTLYLWLRFLRISSIPSQATPTVESPTAAYCLCKTSSISPATLPVSHWDHSGRISALVLPIMSLQVPPESGLFERNQEKDCIEPQKVVMFSGLFFT